MGVATQAQPVTGVQPRGGRARRYGTALVAVLALGLLGGCSGDAADRGECLTAFRDAQPRAEAPYRTSPLDDAIRRCSSFAHWEHAWQRVPEAHNPSDDAREYLLQRCEVAALAGTTLCEEVTATSVVAR